MSDKPAMDNATALLVAEIVEKNPAPLLLLVENQDELRLELAFQLRAHQMRVLEASNANDCEQLLTLHSPDILLLDINLPDRLGFIIAAEVRARLPKIGIIILTARTQVDDRVLGFEMGADVYLVKPVDVRELHACIKSLYARLNQNTRHELWHFSELSRTLTAPDKRILELTSLEAIAFKTIIQIKGIVCPRETLHETLGFAGLSLNNIRLNTLISRLRNRLVNFDAELRIVTWRNKGYVYAGPPIILQKAT